MSARILVVDDSPTIRRVVTSILTRHDFVAVEAADGLAALAEIQQNRPDLVLVDFVMPKMNGYQLCMTLRQKSEFKSVPVVLMSAKSDRIRGKFVEQTGALDAITKPFDARALMAVVQSALEKSHELGRERSAEALSADDPISSREPSEGSSPQATMSSLRIAEHLARLFVGPLNRLGRGTFQTQELAFAFGSALSPEAGVELAALVADSEFGAQSAEVLAGDLSSVSIAEVLQLLDLQRKTGALTISHKKSRVTFFMRDGALDFATYAGLPEEFLLGRYLVQRGTLTREHLEECIDSARKSGKVLGDYLVSAGDLTEEQLRAALSSQTSELVYEVVRWRSGRFRFVQKAENTLAASAQLGLATGGLVMEGFRRVDEWRLIEDSFEFGDVLYKDEIAIGKLAEQKQLTPGEQQVLSAIDGDVNVGELVDSLGMSSFEACKILYRLLNSRLVKRK